VADKLLVVTSFVALSAVGSIPIWVSIIVVSRDVIISIGTLMVHLLREHVNIAPTRVGKATVVAQLLYVLAVLVGMIAPVPSSVFVVGLVVMLVLTMASGFHYVLRGIRLLSGDGGV